MKKVLGILLILISIPILNVVHGEIVSELAITNSFNDQLSQTIELKPTAHDVPISIEDRDGTVFAEEYVEWRSPLPLAEIPVFVQNLFLDSEDNDFFNHRGFDIAAIARAFLVNSQTDDIKQGASTITQQLVRMRFLTTDKTYERKLTELFYANELEKQMTKNEILEMYLNEMYFGNQVYGIGAASTYYFNRPLDQLSEAEVAFIAAIPNNPTMYNPMTQFEATKMRQERLVNTLVVNQHLTEQEATVIKEAPVVLNIKQKRNEFPSYSTFVLAELEELIAASEGFAKKIAKTDDEANKELIRTRLKERTMEVLSTGVLIETAIDPVKQQQVDHSLTALLGNQNLQAGAVVIDNDTREISAVFGGKNYAKADFHRAYQAVRQPGSAMKPLLAYAPFLESGSYSENTPINSGPICIGSYCPKNVGGGVYGNTSMKEAFRHSHNTAAVRLTERIGIEEAFSYLEPFNFQHIQASDVNYPAVLGGFVEGVTPLELADAYTSFIDGSYVRAHAIRSVKDQNGEVLYEWSTDKVEVWSPPTVETMRSLMKDVVLNGSGRGVSYTTSYTGAKTGTTNDYRDLWTAGLTDQYTTAVWVGYDVPQSMQQLSKQKIHLQAFSAAIR